MGEVIPWRPEPEPTETRQRCQCGHNKFALCAHGAVMCERCKQFQAVKWRDVRGGE